MNVLLPPTFQYYNGYIFPLKQYRAYYGAFKAVTKKNRTSEEAGDLSALRFISVISIADPWIFIIFRTSVFRMFFHKIFIRPLMYRNWHSNSCQTHMESSLWQSLTVSGKLRNVSHLPSKNHTKKKKDFNLNPKTLSPITKPLNVFSKVFDILTRHCHSMYLNQSGTFFFFFHFKVVIVTRILNIVNNVKSFKAMILIVPTSVLGVPNFLERSWDDGV